MNKNLLLWGSVALAAAAAVLVLARPRAVSAALEHVPSPEGCGCAGRKRAVQARLDEWAKRGTG